MNLVLNGEKRTVPGIHTVSELLEQLSLAMGQVLVERNGQVVQRTQFSTTDLSEGDQIEIVRVVAGG
ncbi:MAG: thiamine biosynthesis protein ThiS [Acidobacteria bacterium]|nr:MAG: thiamine biosynthesis protein ThiS [Acidobacteriota bacterium]